MFVKGKEIYIFRDDNKNVNIPTHFYLGSISNGFGVTESIEISLKGNVYNISVDHNAIDTSNILNIHRYFNGQE